MRYLSLSAFAAACTLALPATAAEAVPVTVSPPSTELMEGPPGFANVGFSTLTPLTSGTVEVYASTDAIRDPADPLVATAAFSPAASTYASARVTLDDRIVNPGGRQTWTLFFQPSAGVELTQSETTVVVTDEDQNQQPRFGPFASVRERRLRFVASFYDTDSAVTIAATYRGRRIATYRGTVPKGLKRFALPISRKTARTISRRGGSIRLTMTGRTPARDLATTVTYRMSRD